MSEGDRTIESLRWAHELGQDDVRALPPIGGHDLIVLPTGKTVTDLEQYLSAPLRVRRAPEFVDVKSFARYVADFKTDASKAFGFLGSLTVVANLDYDAKDAPSWSTHKATLKSIRTPEWAAFQKQNEQWMAQIQFAEFLERWNHVVVEPEAAAVSEIAMNLEGSVNGKFRSTINRANGSASFMFEEETVTGQVKVPTKIMIAVSPFFHSPLVNVLVLLRFRIQDGSPKFQLVIQNAERIEYEAMTATFKEVEAQTGLPVLVGP